MCIRTVPVPLDGGAAGAAAFDAAVSSFLESTYRDDGDGDSDDVEEVEGENDEQQIPRQPKRRLPRVPALDDVRALDAALRRWGLPHGPPRDDAGNDNGGDPPSPFPSGSPLSRLAEAAACLQAGASSGCRGVGAGTGAADAARLPDEACLVSHPALQIVATKWESVNKPAAAR